MNRCPVVEIIMKKAQWVLSFLLFLTLSSSVYAQLKTTKIVQYDHDVYAEMKTEKGIEIPIRYYLKDGEKKIELEEDEMGYGYKYEEENDKYYAIGIDGKQYILKFKPELAVCIEKDRAYDAKCNEIAIDYKQHPEAYEDVTLISNGVVHYYIDKSGYEWVYASEGLGIHVLEDEGVYMIFDELKFVRKKDVGVVEKMPAPGYDILEYLSKNVKYPKEAYDSGEQGRVVVQFVVEKDGSLTDVKVVRSVSPPLDKEAVSVVSKMPKWKNPGLRNGEPVRVKYSLPVMFRFQ